jgi:hypothetical protein
MKRPSGEHLRTFAVAAGAVGVAGGAVGVAMGTTEGAGRGGARLSRRALVGAIALVVLMPVVIAGLLTWSMGGSDSNLGSLRAAVMRSLICAVAAIPNRNSAMARSHRRCPKNRAC